MCPVSLCAPAAVEEVQQVAQQIVQHMPHLIRQQPKIENLGMLACSASLLERGVQQAVFGVSAGCPDARSVQGRMRVNCVRSIITPSLRESFVKFSAGAVDATHKVLKRFNQSEQAMQLKRNGYTQLALTKDDVERFVTQRSFDEGKVRPWYAQAYDALVLKGTDSSLVDLMWEDISEKVCFLCRVIDTETQRTTPVFLWEDRNTLASKPCGVVCSLAYVQDLTLSSLFQARPTDTFWTRGIMMPWCREGGGVSIVQDPQVITFSMRVNTQNAKGAKVVQSARFASVLDGRGGVCCLGQYVGNAPAEDTVAKGYGFWDEKNESQVGMTPLELLCEAPEGEPLGWLKKKLNERFGVYTAYLRWVSEQARVAAKKATASVDKKRARGKKIADLIRCEQEYTGYKAQQALAREEAQQEYADLQRVLDLSRQEMERTQQASGQQEGAWERDVPETCAHSRKKRSRGGRKKKKQTEAERLGAAEGGLAAAAAPAPEREARAENARINPALNPEGGAGEAATEPLLLCETYAEEAQDIVQKWFKCGEAAISAISGSHLTLKVDKGVTCDLALHNEAMATYVVTSPITLFLNIHTWNAERGANVQEQLADAVQAGKLVRQKAVPDAQP
jgi:hypothetical protein